MNVIADIKLTEEFRTEPEAELWHLISKSKTYDEVADLWHTLVKNQEIVERLKGKVQLLDNDILKNGDKYGMVVGFRDLLQEILESKLPSTVSRPKRDEAGNGSN